MKGLYFLSGSIVFLNAQITCKLLGFCVAWRDTPEIRMSDLGRPFFFLSSPAFCASHCSHTATATPGCCWMFSALPHLSQTTLFFTGALRYSSPSLFLCSLPPLENEVMWHYRCYPTGSENPKCSYTFLKSLTQKTSLRQLKWRPRRSWL